MKCKSCKINIQQQEFLFPFLDNIFKREDFSTFPVLTKNI